MKLYRKKLNNLEELRRECIRLTYERKHSDSSDLMPDIGSLKGSKSKKSRSNTGTNNTQGLLGTAVSLMSGGSSPLKMALSLAGPLISTIGKGAPKRILMKVARDIVIAYAAGKGIQLAAKGIRWYMKERKKKRLAAQVLPAL